jgi:DNA-binding response OmpR family regulator
MTRFVNDSILVVDDDADFLRLVEAILTAKGFAVTTSLEARDAMEKIEGEIFDLVITDANMPGISGFELVRTIRSRPQFNHLSIALLTARRDKKDVETAIKCGADDYIVKPIDEMVLLSKVESLLTKRANQDRPEFSFSESPVHMPADWRVTSQVYRVSEQGMVILSPISVEKGTKFKVASPLFGELDIEPPPLRVVSCQPAPDRPFQFLTRVTFIGLTDQERQKIRAWVNSRTGIIKKEEKKERKAS